MGEEYLKVNKALIRETIKGMLDFDVKRSIEVKLEEFNFDKLIKDAIRLHTKDEFVKVVHEEVKYLFKNEDITVGGVLSLSDSILEAIRDGISERIRNMKVAF